VRKRDLKDDVKPCDFVEHFNELLCKIEELDRDFMKEKFRVY
jgi:hypothetical protein